MSLQTTGSKRISELVQSDIRAMTIECLRVGGINMGQGLCELPTPPEVVQAAQKALADDTMNTYSQPEGILPLRQAIAKKLQQENGITADPLTEIIVTNGATGGYAATLMALFNPGDGVLLFEPYYGYHVNPAILSEVEPQYVPAGPDLLKIDEQAIRKSIQPNTKAILICTPGNPSGKMWSREEIQIVGQIAKEHNLLIITDEMYEYFRFDGRQHISPASIPELKDRTITMMGLSKTYSITGWRLGYVAAPAPLAHKIKLATDLFYVCSPTPLQFGAIAGFNIGPKYFTDLQEDMQAKRDQICEALEIGGFRPVVPQGAYYVLADISKFGYSDSKAFAMALLEKAKIATVPGRAFFTTKQGDNYVRLCFGVNDEKLKTACDRLKALKGNL